MLLTIVTCPVLIDECLKLQPVSVFNENPFRTIANKSLIQSSCSKPFCWAWWYRLVVLVPQEAQAGGLQVQGLPGKTVSARPVWAA